MDNFFGVVNKLDRTVALLWYAPTSVLGKILQLNTLIASQFVYRLTLLPSPSHFTLRALNQYYYNFIWHGGCHRIPSSTMQKSLSHSGFNMLNVYWQECSLKFVWLHRAIQCPDNPSLWQDYIVNAFVIPFHLFFQLNLNGRKIKAFVKKGPLPPFWRSVLLLWFKNKFISPRNLQPNVSELLQRPVC